MLALLVVSLYFGHDNTSSMFSSQLQCGVLLYCEDFCQLVLLLTTFRYIEVYFSGVKKKCLLLCHAVMDPILSCVEVFVCGCYVALNVTVTYLQEYVHKILFLGLGLKDELEQYVAKYQVGEGTLCFVMTDENEVLKGENAL